MADDRGRDLPDLEMPSLFGRRRKRGRDAAQAPDEPPTTLEVAASEAPTTATPATPATPAAPAARRPPPTPPPASRPSVTPAPAAAAPVTSSTPDTQPIAARATETPARPPRPTAPPPRRGPEMTWVTPAPVAAPEPEPAPAPAPAAEPAARSVEPPQRPRRRPVVPDLSALAAAARRVPVPARLPVSSIGLRGRAAAAVTGVVVVVLGVVLLWGTLQACTAVRGVASCGGVGLLAILAVLVLQVLVGAVLLAAWRVAEPRGTSMLGVGLVSTIAMVLLYASTPTPVLSAMLVLVGPAAYVVAQGVTGSTFQLRD